MKNQPTKLFRSITYIIAFTFTVLVTICVFQLNPKTGQVQAENYPTITSIDNFCEQLAQQIYHHDINKTYKVTNSAVANTIMNMTFEDLSTHYNPNSPLTSGCYLCYYITQFNLCYYNNGTLRVVLTLPYYSEDMERHFTEMKALVNELKGDSDYETILNVHDYLIENFEYDSRPENMNHTDIDGFKDKEMVCTGYSLAAYYLLNQAGIPTRVITGYGGTDAPTESNHMWNLVMLDNNWYNMDITWDDQGGAAKSYKYFLKNDEDFQSHVRMGYYNSDKINQLVSKTSYPLPLRMKLLSGGINPYYALIAIALLVQVIIFAIKIIKRKQASLY